MDMPVGMHGSMGDSRVMTGAAAMPTDMPCCPDNSPGPDCGKDCPCVALCAAETPNIVRLGSLFVPKRLVSIIVPGDEAEPSSLAQAAPTRPPKI